MNKKNLFAWASISENGNVGGKKGDSTGKEVKTGYYYDFGQTHCIRIKNVAKRRKVAEIAKYFANDNRIGYSQKDRNDFFNQARNNGWDFSKIKKNLTLSNTDCSSFYATCVNIAFGKEIFKIDSYTGNLITRASNNSKFKVMAIKEAEKAFKKGDGVIKPYKHIIINV